MGRWLIEDGIDVVDYLEKKGYPCFLSVNMRIYANLSKRIPDLKPAMPADYWENLKLFTGEDLKKILEEEG